MFDVDEYIDDILDDEEGLTEKEIVWKRISEPARKVYTFDVGKMSMQQVRQIIKRLEERHGSR